MQEGLHLRDFKSGQKDCKSGQGFQVGAEITNQGKRNYKPEQGFQIGARITNRHRATLTGRIKLLLGL